MWYYSRVRVLFQWSEIPKAGFIPQIQTNWGEADSMIQTDRRVRKTKKAIQEAYFKLLEKKRTEKITVAEITREADIDRKTFYLHYTSVQDLIREFTEAKTKDILKRLTLRSFFLLKFDRQIFTREAVSLVSENLDFLKIVTCSPDLDFFWNTAQDTAVDVLTEIYARHSSLPVSDLRIQVRFFVGGASATYRDWMQGKIPCSLEELSNSVSKIAFTGVQHILQNPQPDVPC